MLTKEENGMVQLLVSGLMLVQSNHMIDDASTKELQFAAETFDSYIDSITEKTE